MTASLQNPQSSSPSDIVSTRLFAVPRETLYDAFRDPAQLILWWGPKGFHNTFQEFDFQLGGHWRFTMHGPDGTTYNIVKRFTEIVPSERIVFLHIDPTHQFQMTMIFTEEANGARLTLRMRFDSAEETEKLRNFITSANEENFDRLEAHLEAMPAADEIVLTRHFEASREKLFQAWTDETILANWWAPHIFTNPVCILDVRPGGTYRIVMRSPEGIDYPLKGVYQEVLKPEHLVMTMDCSEHPADWHDVVKPDRNPDETNPAGEMLLTISFMEKDGQTTLIIRTRFQSTSIRKAFTRMGMNDGWNESLDSLAALLTQVEDRI